MLSVKAWLQAVAGGRLSALGITNLIGDDVHGEHTQIHQLGSMCACMYTLIIQEFHRSMCRQQPHR